MNISDLLGKTKLLVEAVPPTLSTGDLFAASLPSKEPSATDRWSWLEDKYPQTYSAFMAIADIRPDLVFEIIEYPHAPHGAFTSFILGDGDFRALSDISVDDNDEEPWPIKVDAIHATVMCVNSAGHAMGALTDTTAAKAVRKYAIDKDFVTLEEKTGPSGKIRNILKAGQAKYAQPNPAGSPNRGAPRLKLVID